jgi:hypothetical protein
MDDLIYLKCEPNQIKEGSKFCKDLCPLDWEHRDGKCITKCDPKETDIKDKCYGSCPEMYTVNPTDPEKCIKDCPLNFVSDGMKCTESCLPPNNLDGDRCTKPCGPAQEMISGKCMNGCNTGSTIMASDKSKCKLECPSGYTASDTECTEQCKFNEIKRGLECIEINQCTQNQESIGDSCYNQCPPGTTLSENKLNCNTDCPSGTELDGSKCKRISCPANYELDSSKQMCTNKLCPSGYEPLQGQCYSICPSGSVRLRDNPTVCQKQERDMKCNADETMNVALTGNFGTGDGYRYAFDDIRNMRNFKCVKNQSCPAGETLRVGFNGQESVCIKDGYSSSSTTDCTGKWFCTPRTNYFYVNPVHTNIGVPSTRDITTESITNSVIKRYEETASTVTLTEQTVNIRGSVPKKIRTLNIIPRTVTERTGSNVDFFNIRELTQEVIPRPATEKKTDITNENLNIVERKLNFLYIIPSIIIILIILYIISKFIM